MCHLIFISFVRVAIRSIRSRASSLNAAYSTDRDGSEQSLGHVGDDDADEEDDGVEPEVQRGRNVRRPRRTTARRGVEPEVAEREGDQEEGETEEDGDGGDNVDEVGDLARDRRLDGLECPVLPRRPEMEPGQAD